MSGQPQGNGDSLKYNTTYTKTLEDASTFFESAYQDLGSSQVNSIYLKNALTDTNIFSDSDVKTLLPNFSSDKAAMNNLITAIEDESESLLGDVATYSYISSEFVSTIAKLEEYLETADKDSATYTDMMEAFKNGTSLEAFFSEETGWADNVAGFFEAELKAGGKKALKELFKDSISEGIKRNLAAAAINIGVDVLDMDIYSSIKGGILEFINNTVKSGMEAKGLATTKPFNEATTGQVIMGSLATALITFVCNEALSAAQGKNILDAEVLATNAAKAGVSVVSSLLGDALVASLGLTGTTGGVALGITFATGLAYLGSLAVDKISYNFTHTEDGYSYNYEEITADGVRQQLLDQGLIHEAPTVEVNGETKSIYDLERDLRASGVDEDAANFITALYGGREDVTQFFTGDRGIRTPEVLATEMYLVTYPYGEVDDLMYQARCCGVEERYTYTDADWARTQEVLESLVGSTNTPAMDKVAEDYNNAVIDPEEIEYRYGQALSA